MRQLRVRCTECAEVTVASDEVHVRQLDPGRMAFSFCCPQCGKEITKECDSQVGRLLLLGGATAEEATIATLDAFRMDHVVELRNLLDQPDWFERFRQAS
jgi:hypothetical protein